MNPTAPIIPDVSVWQQLGPAGGVLAFIVLCLWLYRENTWAQRERAWLEQRERDVKESQATHERQWMMLTELVKTTATDFREALDKSTAAWVSVKTFLETRLHNNGK